MSFRKPVYGSVKSPTRKKLDELDEGQTQAMMVEVMVEVMGEDKPWTTSWEAAHEAAEIKGTLAFPRYYAKTRAGKWVVKEHQNFPLAIEPTGPMAICKALLLVEIGKGKDYSPWGREETEDEQCEIEAVVGHGRRSGGLHGGNGQDVSRDITIKVSEPPKRRSMGHISPV